MNKQENPMVIQVRNAHVHNLKHIDVDIPLNKIVGIAGVSGSPWRTVCGRLSSVLGCTFHLYPAQNDAGTTGAGG